ncbi:hypothetical protein EMM73_17305 [Rheinheimera sediminis]|uniref:hypothetical protein n=1 Tax=Rheinheimera sp. YQF-1 TaxID=2499626 RepID=UPI000FD71B7B|nr:hypothetical protein [Rheinheimera sp. YQF-1]RVT44115.1 hypothetical protein EMM73_17305 [Rheinheimera sp. YQF-1]
MRQSVFIIFFMAIFSFCVFMAFLLLMTRNDNDGAISICHDAVQAEAKYTAEIVNTEVLKRNSVDTVIFGKAKFQNGFGAWSNKVYRCDFANDKKTKFELFDSWDAYPPHKFG